MDVRGRPAVRWVLVALFAALSMGGVPGILSFAQPRRERDDAAVVLIAGEGVARLPAG